MSWASNTLSLAFWHAMHRILAPLPPGALPPGDVAPILDAAFDALLASANRPNATTPPWEQWGGRPLAGGALDADADAAGASLSGSGSHDAAAPVDLVPSPPVSELAARCLGLASRHDPAAAAERAARELEPRAPAESKRAEAHAIIHGVRYLYVSLDGAAPGPSTATRREGFLGTQAADSGLRSAATVLRHLNPTAWSPAHRKSDLRHALCALLTAVLAPVAGARVPDAASSAARADWADAVSACRGDVAAWIKSKEKKHSPAGLPLLGALHAAEALCGGDGGNMLHAFLDTTIVRAFKERSCRTAATEALRAIVEGIAPPLLPGARAPSPPAPPLPNVTRTRLRTALTMAAAAVKKGGQGDDGGLAAAVARATAAMVRVDPLLSADVVVELLREGGVSEATAAGLDAVPGIILLTSERWRGKRPPPGPGAEASSSAEPPAPGLAGVLQCMRDSGLDPLSGLVKRISDQEKEESGDGTGAQIAAERMLEDLRAKLGGVASALGASSNPSSPDAVAVAVALLRCVPFIVPEAWRGAALGESITPLCANPHASVRAAAGDAIRRAVAATPATRDAIVQGAAGTLLRPHSAVNASPGVALTDVNVASSAAATIKDACAAWRVALGESESSSSASTSERTAAWVECNTLGTLRPEAAGLLLLCSPSPVVRVAAVEMLREVAALAAALRRAGGVVVAGGAGASAHASPSPVSLRATPFNARDPGRNDASAASATATAPSMSSVVEQCASDMMLAALGGDGFGAGFGAAGDVGAHAATAAAAGAAAVAGHVHGGAWCASLGVLASRAAALSPEVTTTARAQALQRVQAIMMQEGLQHKTAGPRAPIDPSTVKFEMWRNCTCFVCAASPSELDGASVSLASVQQTLVGNRGSLSGLFALLVPCLREGGAQAAAAAAVLARVPALAAPQLLAALAPLQGALSGGVGSERAAGGTPFDRKKEDLELRTHLAWLHFRLAAGGAVAAAQTGREAVAKHLLFFVDATVAYAHSTSAAIECSPDEMARLQFAAAATATAAAPQILARAPDAAPPDLRARLFERFHGWEQKAMAEGASDGGGGGGGGGGNFPSIHERISHDRRHSMDPLARMSMLERHLHGAASLSSMDSGSTSLSSLSRAHSHSRHRRRDSFREGGSTHGGSIAGDDSVSVTGGGGGGGGGGGDRYAENILSAWRGPAASMAAMSGGIDRAALGLPPPSSHSHDGGDDRDRDRDRDRAADDASRYSDDVSSVGGRSATGAGAFDAGISPAAVSRASREAMAALLAGPAFDADSEQATGRVLTWIRSLLESGRASAAAVARRALRYHLGANPRLAHTALDACYSAHERTAASHLSALADLYAAAARTAAEGSSHADRSNAASPPLSPMASGAWNAAAAARAYADGGRVDPPSCHPAKLIVLVLYKLVHPSAGVRDDAVALLKATAALELSGAGGNGDVDDRGGAILGEKDLIAELTSQDSLPELPDAYQAFQQGASRQLARRHSNLGEDLLVEALERQMDEGAADAGAHRHVLAALAPWVATLHLPHIAAAGRAERLLRALYFVTFFRGDAFPREIETLWRHIGRSPRNVVPALRFLESKGLEDTSSAVAIGTYVLTAKRVCLYLARAAPQQSIDQLVYAISLRGLEVDYPPRPIHDDRQRYFHGGGSGGGGGSIVAGSVSSFGADRSDLSADADGGGGGGDDDEDGAMLITAPDLAIILLAEVAAEHDEDFRVHLPVLLHAVTATLLGSPEPTVRAHCRQLLANLTHALAARPLSARGKSARGGVHANGAFHRSASLAPSHAAPAHAASPGVNGGWEGEVSQWGYAGIAGSPGQGTRHGSHGGGMSGSSHANASAWGAPNDVGGFGYGADAGHHSGIGMQGGVNALGGSYGGGDATNDDDDARGRAAVAKLQALLARPGPGGAGKENVSAAGVKHAPGGGGHGASEGGASWTPESVASLVGLLPDAMIFEPGLREQWADEARRWLLRAASFPLAAASARVLASLKVPLDVESSEALLAALCSSAAAAEGGTVANGLGYGRGSGYGGMYGGGGGGGGGGMVISARSASLAADLAGLLLDTLSEMLSRAGSEIEIVPYPHVLWGAASCLRTMNVSLYARAAKLFSVMASAWPLDDPSGAGAEILRVASPLPIGSNYDARAVIERVSAVAELIWTSGKGPKAFRGAWAPPYELPAPAMGLRDVIPLLLKGFVRGESVGHAARALTAIVSSAGCERRAWGGERGLALATAGLLPLVLAAAAAAEEEEDAGGGGGAAAAAAAAGTENGDDASGGGSSASASPAATIARAKAGPLGTREGAAAGRWLASGIRGGRGGANENMDVLAATLESILPPPRRAAAASSSGGGGGGGGRRRDAVKPKKLSRPLPPHPPPSPPGTPRVARLAEIIAAPLAKFFFPRHGVAATRVLVDVAASQGEGGGDGVGPAAAAAALALLSSLTARARGSAAAALFDAPADPHARHPGGGGGGGGARVVSLFAPVASLLDGTHSTAALDLLQRVATRAAEIRNVDVEEEDDEDYDEYETSRRREDEAWWTACGSPAQTWDSVDANGGRAVDLMCGVVSSAGMDPHAAGLPACLVRDSADQ